MNSVTPLWFLLYITNTYDMWEIIMEDKALVSISLILLGPKKSVKSAKFRGVLTPPAPFHKPLTPHTKGIVSLYVWKLSLK